MLGLRGLKVQPMPYLRQHASDSFARKPSKPAPMRGREALRKNELSEACSALLEACQDANPQALKAVLDDNIELVPQIINAQDDSGWTALHICVGWCAEDCITLLLKRGADPDICNDQGQNVRDLAVQLGYDALAPRIVPVPGARDAALRQARQAEMKADIEIITRGLPENITITCMHLNLKPHGRRPN